VRPNRADRLSNSLGPAFARGPAAAITAGAVTLLLLTVVAPDRVPLGVVLLGALLGTGTGLLAVGLVLTYRSHRIVNFALGGIGGVGAGVAIGLHLGKGWPWPCCGASSGRRALS
jgi:hypothetical protein